MKNISPLYLGAGQHTRAAENLTSGLASAPLSDKAAKSFRPQSSWPRAATEQQLWAVKAHERSGIRTMVAQGRGICGAKDLAALSESGAEARPEVRFSAALVCRPAPR